VRRRHALKKPGRRNLEHEREFDQAAGADAIHATLVFLNLLEGQAHPLRQVTLGKSHQLALRSEPLTDMNIDGMGLASLGRPSATR
jgi:hypothetical protein